METHTPTCDDPRKQVKRPTHYTYSNIEVWDAIVAWNLLFCEGNVIKYIARANHHTAGKLNNLLKAKQYLLKAIEVEEAKLNDIETDIIPSTYPHLPNR